MRKLLGAKLRRRRQVETTHLYWASVQGEHDIVHLLLADGADPDEQSPGEDEGTPLCAAACHGHTEIVRELLEHGADPDLMEDEWFTPLRWAASNGHEDSARLLLEHRADPDLGAPLPAAARRGSLGIVRALLERGADPHLVDADGRTALAIAEDWAAKDIESELAARVEEWVESRGPVEIVRRREPRPDGTELVSVEASLPDGLTTGSELQTGHAEIAALLRSRQA